MDFRKLISIWALLALMLGQVTLAQHSATHIDHGFSQEIITSHDGHNHHHEHHDQNENDEHQCPECLLTKSLQVAFYNASTSLSVPPQSEGLLLSHESSVIVIDHYQANSPRAPPVNLI